MQKFTLSLTIILLFFQSIEAISQNEIPLPNYGSSGTGLARGYWFTAPTDFIITGLRVPMDIGLDDQNIQLVKFTNSPPSTPSTTTSFQTLGHWKGISDSVISSTYLFIDKGDIIGVLGTRGSNSTNSYSSTSGPFSSSILGQSVNLTRLQYQGDIHLNPASDFSQYASANLARVEIFYTSPMVGHNNASVLSIDSPKVFCSGSANVYATIRNAGVNQIDSVEIHWEINGIAQNTLKNIQLIDTVNGSSPNSISVLLGSGNFNAGNNTIQVYTSFPNGIADTLNFHDTVQVTVKTATVPLEVKVVSKTDSSLVITDRGGAGITRYEYGPANYLKGTGTQVASIMDTILINGLVPNTDYDFYVQSFCGVNDTSTWEGPYTFSTLHGIPYWEDFESFIPNSVNQLGWTNHQLYPPWKSGSFTPSHYTGPNKDHTIGTGGMFAYLDASTGYKGDSSDLISPLIYVDTSMNSVELSFWYHKYGSDMGDLKVYVDMNGVSNLIGVIKGQIHSQSSQWSKFSAYLTGYKGKKISLRFTGVKGGYEGDMAIDDIMIKKVPPNDAAMEGISDILKGICPGKSVPVVSIRNNGGDTLKTAKIIYSFNGILDSVLFTGNLSPTHSQDVPLDSVTFISGVSYDLVIYTKDPNNVVDTLNHNDTLYYTGIKAGLTGNYTIDTSKAVSTTNYHSFVEIANDLKHGVCGAVDIKIAPSTYYDFLSLKHINGASPTNTITFDGGDSSTTILSHNNSQSYATISLSGADYVTIKNMTVEASGSTGATVQIAHGANNNVISNNELKANTSSTNPDLRNVIFISYKSGYRLATNVDYNKIINNKIRGGYFGIHATGSIDNLNQNNKIIGNKIDSIYKLGIYATWQDSLEISGNDLDITERSKTADGIQLLQLDNLILSENNIQAGGYGVYIRRNSNTPSKRKTQIINNMIIAHSEYGLYLHYIDSAKVVNNSISVHGTFSHAFSLQSDIYKPLDKYEVSNNIFYSKKNLAFTSNVPDSIYSNFDHNIFYTESANLLNIDGKYYDSLKSFQSAHPAFNIHSFQRDPEFVSPTSDLHISFGSTLVNDIGDSTVDVLYDIDGDSRPMPGSAVMDIGADEYTPAALNAGIKEIISHSGPLCAGTYPIILSISNNGLDTIFSIDIISSVNGVNDTIHSLDTIIPSQAINVSINPITLIARDSNDLILYTHAPNGGVDEFNLDDTISILNSKPALGGNYTIDTSLAISATNYHTFSSFVDDLNYGVCGPVNVSVAAATYYEFLYINKINNASSINTITFKGVDSSSCILSHDGTVKHASLTFDGSKYIRVMNMTIKTNGVKGATVSFVNGPEHNIVSNNQLISNTGINTTFMANVQFSPYTKANYNTISNNKILGGYNGIFINADNNGLHVNNKIIGNKIDSAYACGICAYYQDSLVVSNNVIDMTTRSNPKADGVYMWYSHNSVLSSNYIHVPDVGASIYRFWDYAPLKRKTQVINNMIISDSSVGLYVYFIDSAYIAHNSISVYGNKSPAVYIFGDASHPLRKYDVRNNIFSSKNTNSMGVHSPHSMFSEFDHNIFYSGSKNLFYISGSNYDSLTAYQNDYPTFNNSSIQTKPMFVAVDNLHMTNNIANNKGDNTLGITVDIDGDSRPNGTDTIVDIGADEFQTISCPPLYSATLNTINHSINSIKIHWIPNISHYRFEYGIKGFVQDSGSIAISTSDTALITGLSPQTVYDIYIQEICSLGDSSIWTGPYEFRTPHSLPFAEDFEEFSPKRNVAIDQYAWYDNSNTNPKWELGEFTSSYYTGPNHDHSTGQTGNFVFLETSLPAATYDSSDLLSPFIFIDSFIDSINLSFWYHKYGANMGDLEVYVDTNGVSNYIASINGETHTSENDAWKLFSLNLGGYEDKFIRLRFRGFRDNSYTGDMAIDDISIREVPAIDASITGIIPVEDKYKCYSSTENVKIQLSSRGTDSINFAVDTAYFNLKITGAITQTLTYELNDNSIKGRPLFQTDTIALPMGLINMSMPGTYYFEASLIMDKDGYTNNNIFMDSIEVLQAYAGSLLGPDSSCFGDTIRLSMDTLIGEPQWQRFINGNFVNDTGAQSIIYDVVLDSTITFRALVCGNALSDTMTIVSKFVPKPKITSDTARIFCGNAGTALLLANPSSTNSSFMWYDAAFGGNRIKSGGNINLSKSGDSLYYTALPVDMNNASIDTFYVKEIIAGISDSCSSNRTMAIAVVECKPFPDLGLSSLLAPSLSSNCYTASENVEVELVNTKYGESIDFLVDSIDIVVNVTGTVNQKLSYRINNNQLNSGQTFQAKDTIRVSIGTFNMTAPGNYAFEAYLITDFDTLNLNDTIRTSISNFTSAGLPIGIDTICEKTIVKLSTLGSVGELQWQRLVSGTFSDEVGADSSVINVSIDSTSSFRVVACETEFSDTLTVVLHQIPAPIILNDTAIVFCGDSGTAVLSASSLLTGTDFKWYEDSMTSVSLLTGDTLYYGLNTQKQSVTTEYVDTFYVAAVDSISSCESERSIAIGSVICTVGKDEMQTEKLSIHPNPSKGKFNIIGSKLSEELDVKIYNANGKLVYHLDNKISNDFNVPINLSGLSKGIYLVKFQGKTTMRIVKVVIQ